MLLATILSVFEEYQSVDNGDTDMESENNRLMFYIVIGVLVFSFNAIAAAFVFQRFVNKREKKKVEDMKKRIADQGITPEKMEMVMKVLGISKDINKGGGLSRTRSKTLQFNAFLDNIKQFSSSYRTSGGAKRDSQKQWKEEEIRQADSLSSGNHAANAGHSRSSLRDIKEEDGGGGEEEEEEEEEDHPPLSTLIKASESSDPYELDSAVPVVMNEDEKEAMQATANNVMKDLQIPVDQIDIEQYSIAKGAFGEIHMGNYKGSRVALKTLILLDEESLVLFKHEILLSAQLQHPNIILLIGACWDRNLIAMVLEFADGGR